MIQVPKLTQAHEKLKTLVGTWRGTETIHPSPFDKKGGQATGIVNNRLAIDGFAVIQDYEQQRDGRTNFRGQASSAGTAIRMRTCCTGWIRSEGRSARCAGPSTAM